MNKLRLYIKDYENKFSLIEKTIEMVPYPNAENKVLYIREDIVFAYINAEINKMIDAAGIILKSKQSKT
jgi:hypothetical protein